jgi:hypothetical protein
MRKSATKSRSSDRDRTLGVKKIEAAFMSAGLEREYRTLVAALGENALAERMIERWLDLTIRDLLASRRHARASGRRRARRGVKVPA